ncbi:MAG: trypsin-like peptidase domain-containing protein [Candidatus Obscuribacter sp.]|nr:trypsin-like peptidase domain-containing protein [Candidatus Obscuribacter sp.]
MAKDSPDSKNDDCSQKPVINEKGFLEPVDTCHGSLLGSVLEKYQDKTVKVMVNREFGREAGSGFFIGDGTQVMTDAHVVNNSKNIEIQTPDGQKRAGHIVKLDDVNDLAVVQVEGLKPDPSRAVDVMNTSVLTQGSWVFGLGTPHLDNTKQFLSPGRAMALTTVRDIMARTGALEQRSAAGDPPTLGEWIMKGANSGNPRDRQDVQDYLSASRIDLVMGAFPGQSGQVNVGEDLKFAGVANATYKRADGTIGTTIVPDDTVQHFLRSPSKFDFNYERQSLAQASPLTTYSRYMLDAAVPASATGAATLAAESRMGSIARFVPGAFGIYKASGILDNYKSYSDINNDAERKSYYGQKVAEDAGYGAGGLLLTAGMVASSRIKPVMMGLGALAYAGSYVSSVVREHTPTYSQLKGVQRKDGDPRPPFLWNLSR